MCIQYLMRQHICWRWRLNNVVIERNVELAGNDKEDNDDDDEDVVMTEHV